jgi:glucosamine-6-phosphate deaminase
MQLERLPDARSVAVRGADIVSALVARDPEAVLLLPAGETPVPLYAELARRRRAGRLDLERAHLFQLDELVGVPPADERSFHYFFERHLARPLGLGERLHLLDGCARDPAAEIARHAGVLRELGGADLVLLGLGKNGHVAFNEPGSRPGDGAREVALCPSTVQGLRAQFADGGVPAHGMTFGLAEIAAARSIAMLVTGRAKAGILAALLAGERSSKCPASLLAGHADFVVLADEAACTELV